MPGAALIAAAVEAEMSAAARHRAADAEIGLRAAGRLDDEARARASLIADAVIGEVSTLLRAAEPMLDGAGVDEVPRRLAEAGLVARSGLAAAALARADEHRLAAALARAAVSDTEAEGPDPADPSLADEAHAVRQAEAARLDRVGDPLLPLHDLAAEDRHALFWHVAACLADLGLARLGDARAGAEDAMHRGAAAAVSRTLAAIDDRAGITAATLRLARRLLEDDALDDDHIAGALAAGRVSLLAAMLAVRAGVAIEAVRATIGDAARLAVLLRACALSREIAAAMILTVALVRADESDPALAAAELIEAFERLPEDRARAEVRRTRLEPHYRDALAALAARP
ncbi:DUF2336 domain-containing protein [Sphingomonas sp.]|uniref:DUF2336 domain-containing protein n=1 Tax=Sphingomonas sp. TaxID=28214 RepID=UPI003AFF7601